MMRQELTASESVSVTQDFSIGLVDDILGAGSSVISTSEPTIMVDDHEIFILSEDIS